MSVKKMVYTFNNLTLEPDDVFQEGLTRLIMNVQSGRFRGDSKLSTYLNSICRNICLKKISRYNTVSLDSETLPELQEEDRYFQMLEFISEVKQGLDQKCRAIIDLRFLQSNEDHADRPLNKLMGFDEIARQLNLTVSNARQRFKRCLDQLRSISLAHPDYQSFTE